MELNISCKKLTKLENLPDNITTLVCYNNKINKL